MVKRKHQIKRHDLSRLLVYILGHRPDEFGLVPDPEGFVPYKELLQSIHEEAGWKYVRQSHINEVLMGKDRILFETKENRIRVLERRWQRVTQPLTEPLPNILLTPIRKKAHPVVMEKGLRPAPGKVLVLTADKDMARRIGGRRDASPVLLEILAGQAQERGIPFFPHGNLFLCSDIPVKYIAGPPVSKETMEALAAAETKKVKPLPTQPEFSPGTFILDPARDPDPHRRAKGKKRKGWKEKARGMRRRINK